MATSTETKQPAVAKKKETSIADSVRTLSPGQMVLKRFFRSKLSMVGLVTLIFLFFFQVSKSATFRLWRLNHTKSANL